MAAAEAQAKAEAQAEAEVDAVDMLEAEVTAEAEHYLGDYGDQDDDDDDAEDENENIGRRNEAERDWTVREVIDDAAEAATQVEALMDFPGGLPPTRSQDGRPKCTSRLMRSEREEAVAILPIWKSLFHGALGLGGKRTHGAGGGPGKVQQPMIGSELADQTGSSFSNEVSADIKNAGETDYMMLSFLAGVVTVFIVGICCVKTVRLVLAALATRLWNPQAVKQAPFAAGATSVALQATAMACFSSRKKKNVNSNSCPIRRYVESLQ